MLESCDKKMKDHPDLYEQVGAVHHSRLPLCLPAEAFWQEIDSLSQSKIAQAFLSPPKRPKCAVLKLFKLLRCSSASASACQVAGRSDESVCLNMPGLAAIDV